MAGEPALDPVELLVQPNPEHFENYLAQNNRPGPTFWRNAFSQVNWDCVRGGARLNGVGAGAFLAAQRVPTDYLYGLGANRVLDGLRLYLTGLCSSESFRDAYGPAAMVAAASHAALVAQAETRPELQRRIQRTEAPARPGDDHTTRLLAEMSELLEPTAVDRRLTRGAVTTLLKHLSGYACLGHRLPQVLFPVVPNGEALTGGILAAEVWLVENSQLARDWDTVPWSLFESEGRGLSELVQGLRQHGWIGEQDKLLLNIRCTEETPGICTFGGESLGLAVAIAACAASKRLWVRSTIMATGEVLANGTTRGVTGMAQKCSHMRKLANTRGLEIGTDCQVLLCPAAGEAIAVDLQGHIPVPINTNLSHLLDQHLDALFDCLSLDGSICKTRHEALISRTTEVPDDDFFFRGLSPSSIKQDGERTIAGQTLSIWRNGLLPAGSQAGSEVSDPSGEILLCTPFHADCETARKVLELSAGLLSTYLNARRDSLADPNLPASIVVDLAEWRIFCGKAEPSRELLLRFMFSEKGPLQPFIQDGRDLLIFRDAAESALASQGRFCFIVIDTDVSRTRTFEDRLAVELAKFCKLVRREGGTGRGDHRVVLVAPDLHVQLWWEQQLKEKMRWIFRAEPFQSFTSI